MKRDLTCRNLECKKLRVSTLHKGFCPTCYAWWLLDTEAGKEYLERTKIKAKPIGQKSRTKQKRELMSSDAYRAKVLQPVINEIARLIDYGQPCIASGVTTGKFSAGHFISVGANRATALNLHNIHIQAYHSNGPQGGQPIEYLEGLKKTYGDEYAAFVMQFRGYTRKHKISKQEMEQAYPKARRARNSLKKRKRKWSANDRIRLRNMVNKYLGLYNTRFETS